MTLEIAIVFGIILIAIVLFVTEWISIDTIAFGIMVTLLVTGIVTPQQGIMGFANQATITILSLMFIGVGLEQSGAIAQMGKRLRPLLGKKEWVTIALLMVIVAFASTFISTTAVVIVFLQILVNLSERMNISLSKLLIPLSFAGILGGSCSLMGTSTNLIVNSVAQDLGYAPFGLFEFSGIGAIFFVAAMVYMVFVGRKLLPARQKKQSFKDSYKIKSFLTTVEIQPNSKMIGKTVKESVFGKERDIELLQIKHQKGPRRFPKEGEIFREGDLLIIRTSLESLKKIYASEGLKFISRKGFTDTGLDSKEIMLCEAMLRPNSQLIGTKMNKLNAQSNFGIIPIAIQKGRKIYADEKIRALKIESGDTVLLEVNKEYFPRLYQSPEWIILQEEIELFPKTDKRYLAMGILVAVVLVAAFNVLPIMISALTGAFAMIITKCVDLQKAYQKIDWSIFFLLAGMIPLGSAMSNTGADAFLANAFVDFVEDGSPQFFIAALFGFTVIMSGFVSNNATAILLTPVAISIATRLGYDDPKGFLLTVMFAANMSFFTPIGYQTNTLIFNPGNYKFRDFILVGGILTLIIWTLATFLIPMFYLR